MTERKRIDSLSTVMPGLVPGIHVFLLVTKTWMAGTIDAKTRFAPLPGHDEE
jgi:hypothetical protein